MSERTVDRLFPRIEEGVSRLGGGRAELHVSRSRVRRYDSRDGGIDSIAFAETLSLGLRVFRDGRMGFSYAFREDDDEIRRMVEAAVFAADASDPDPAYGLPEEDGGGIPAVPLYDPSWETVGEDEKAAFAAEMERLAVAADPRMKRVRAATLVEAITETAFRNSLGGEGAQRASRYHACIDTVAEDGTEGQTGHGFAFARRFADLDPAAVAAEGSHRALRMLSARRLPTGRYPAVLENGAAAELLEVLVPSFLASQLVKGKSMLAGKLGQAVAAPLVEIVDDPFAGCGSGATAFDGEGTPSRRNVLIAEGTLRGYLADAFWGRKMGTGSTASCRRAGPKAPPAVGVSNVRLAPGGTSFEGLLREVGAGVVLTEFLGIHTADPVSGDFSVGAAGIRFERGEEREPVRGFAVSGNIIALLAQVTSVGSDFRWFGNVGAPSLAVAGIEAGGI